MVKELIVTADDFGMHEDFNYGILEAVKAQRVKAVSVLINGPALSENDIRKLIEYVDSGQIRLGLHISLGKPETWKSQSDRCKYHEASSQYLLFDMKFGFFPQHIDGHYHVHILDPAVFGYVNVLNYYGLYTRSRGDEIAKLKKLGFNTCDYFLDGTKEKLSELIPKAKKGLNEIMTHPGFCIPGKKYPTSMTTKRQEDLDFLLSDEFEKLLNKYNIILSVPDNSSQ